MNSGSVTKWPDRSGLLFAASLVCILLIYGLKAAAAVQTGEFGADMKVELLNDGPVTICMDTKNKE